MKLVVFIPAYNEAKTIHVILEKVKEVTLLNDLQKEIIIVNDCSTDNTKEVLEQYISDHPELNIQLYNQEVNKGKGAAIHKGIELATGEFLVVQDADLEYDPEEYNISILILCLIKYLAIIPGDEDPLISSLNSLL